MRASTKAKTPTPTPATETPQIGNSGGLEREQVLVIVAAREHLEDRRQGDRAGEDDPVVRGQLDARRAGQDVAEADGDACPGPRR